MANPTLPGNLTALIQRAVDGDGRAESELCQAVYGELHAVARRLLGDFDASLQPTMLVHDVYMRLIRQQGLKHVPSRRYFYAVAADQMHRLLIDHHRRRTSLKAGGNWSRVPFDLVLDEILNQFHARNHCDIEALEAALAKLRQNNERQYHVVIYRYFGSLTIKETAEMLDTAVSNVERDWRLARAKLYRYLTGDCEGPHA